MSTVLDVAVCLLLIGVAVTTLTASIPGDGGSTAPDAEPVAASLITVTATVHTDGYGAVHGTVAEQLARATVVGTTLDGSALTASAYPDAVRTAVDDHTPGWTRITARWSPYPDAALESRIAVGPKPPESADVAAAKLTVNSGIDTTEVVGSFDEIAASIATAYVDRLFPPDRIRVQLVDPRTAGETADRYRAVAETIGADRGIERGIADGAAHRTNDRLSAALADRLEADLRASYETPAAAAADLETERIELVVRRWEP